MIIAFVKSGYITVIDHVYFIPALPSTNTYNMYSITIGPTYPNSPLPIETTFCSGGPFKINTLTGADCPNMFLDMDPTNLMLTANFPYPNLLCTLNF